MTPFATDQWVMLALVFLLGFFLGGWLLAGTKWKRHYREEVVRRETLEREYKHGGAMDIAARARGDAATTTTTTRPVA